MKKLFLLLFLCTASFLYSNGVAVVDASSGVYLKLLSSSVSVSVDNQVSITTSTQIFKNLFTSQRNVKYAFPVPEGASATSLEWYINGSWHNAVFVAGSQDSSLPGGTMNAQLTEYIGKTPLFFTIPEAVKADSNLIVRITYVELLKYEFGKVYYRYPNDYHLIQTSSINKQELNFSLNSQRTIDSIKITSHTPITLISNKNIASIFCASEQTSAVADYQIEYTLNSNELGLFSMSSYVQNSLLPDSVGRGFFTFIAEPNPNQTNVINKVFTLIIDRSGSMDGNKMVQAKQAAVFIVNHLNEGDKFNIIDFDGEITSFKPEHISFNAENKLAALTFINNLYARGMTNISGAFERAIPQFTSVNNSTSNIIIFLTDGEATEGITETQGILNSVNNLTAQSDTLLNIFTFGIGSYVNEQLLTLLASQHHGLCEFLKNDELEKRVSQFYLKIRNPVLINTKLNISSDLVLQTYPNPLPNLYKGQQLIVSGRYKEPGNVNVTLSGTAFGQPVTYEYQMHLSDSSIASYQFLTKIWAKLKIENLMVMYFSLDPNSQQAGTIKEQIIWLSIKYGVTSNFTNLSENVTGIEEHPANDISESISPKDFEIKGNYPNPFNPSTSIVFNVKNAVNDYAVIRIYNTLGELIKEFRLFITAKGEYKVTWNGLDENGKQVSSGNYLYVISYNNSISAGKMTLMK